MIVLVASMTDAPGIGRTLDSLIVILAGVVVLLLRVRPGERSLVTFWLGDHRWLASALSLAVGVLFVV